MRQRVHNEWFRPVSLGGRKSCPSCGSKLAQGESVWSWGEYHNAKFRLVKHFCMNCFPSRVREPLQSHTAQCGCSVSIQTMGHVCPEWLTI